MIRHTGGFAVGAISTRSSSAASACALAAAMLTIPTCSPFGPISLTSGALISPLMRGSFSWTIQKPRYIKKLCREPELLRLAVEALDEGLYRHLAEVCTGAGPHGNRLRRHLFVTCDDLIGQLLQTMFTDFIGYFLISQVGFRAQPGPPELIQHLLRVRRLVGADIHDHDLHRSEPHRKRSGI